MRVSRACLIFIVFVGCARQYVTARPSWVSSAELGCGVAPHAAPAVGFRHRRNQLVAALGAPLHRSTDLITSVAAVEQRIEGQLAYGADKASEDEGVDVFVCLADRWRMIGEARTDDDGHFAIVLTGGARLPVGLHPLYASAIADRSGVGFLGYIAPTDASVAIADVDGTLSASENGIVRSIVLGSPLAAQPGASDAFGTLASAGYQVVYLTARPRGTTELTRGWLAEHGFPPGPIVMAPGLTLPGRMTLAHKSGSLDRLRASGVPLTIGIGNRATDVLAYSHAGLAAERIFIKQSEFATELDPYLKTRRATGFVAYAELAGLVTASRR